MEKIKEEFRLFQGNEDSNITINISADYPSTYENLELLKQKYPEISNQLSIIYDSFKSFDRKDYMFFEGTLEQNGVILPFVNYVCLNRWSSSVENQVKKGRNFILIPNRGIQLYNLGDYNGDITRATETYQQDLEQKTDEHFDRQLLLEKYNDSIRRLMFYYKDGADKYTFRIYKGHQNRQNLYCSSHGYFNANCLELPEIIFDGATIEYSVCNYETNEENEYGMLLDNNTLLGLYIHSKKDNDGKVTLYGLDRKTGKYKKYFGYKNASNEMRSFKEDTSSTLLSSDEVMLAVGQRLPNVIEFSKIIKPVIDHPNYYNIPYEVVAISDECVNYARAKSDDVGKHKYNKFLVTY